MGYTTDAVIRQASHQHPTALTRLFIRGVRKDLANLNQELLQECWNIWMPITPPQNDPTIHECNIINWNDTTQEAKYMEWDQQTLDMVTSNKPTSPTT
eukprot:12660235-Heterocapsa_arctica.AAC.1